ncbi:hypothetical protein HMPREF9373_2471 [Psychrobacter sp. 1501(2011)]|nr:hypothetical protein HMPREF9373_2471 [Psychrobacter sp. 1501(2011)]
MSLSTVNNADYFCLILHTQLLNWISNEFIESNSLKEIDKTNKHAKILK